MHIKLTGFYADATPEKFISFTARLPFGQRLLLPAIAHFFSLFLPISPQILFMILELTVVSLAFLFLFKLLRIELAEKLALSFTWLFFILLPLISILNYRFTLGGDATFFYPADSASLLFMAMGYYFCLQKQWLKFYLTLFVACFNRETAFLLVLLLPALYWPQRKTDYKHWFVALMIYLLARLMVIALTYHLPGHYTEWYFRDSMHTHFEVNLFWLLNEFNAVYFAYCLLCLPLFWFFLYDYIPFRYRPIRYLALVYFLGLLVVGNFMEARIFHELTILLYLPVCLALKNWYLETMLVTSSTRWMDYLNRYSIITALILVVLLRQYINNIVLFFAH